MAMTSGSKSETNLESSDQSFFTRRRKLLAFQVTNFVGSFWFFPSSTPSSGERQGFLGADEPSFSMGLKNRFIAPFFVFINPIKNWNANLKGRNFNNSILLRKEKDSGFVHGRLVYPSTVEKFGTSDYNETHKSKTFLHNQMSKNPNNTH